MFRLRWAIVVWAVILLVISFRVVLTKGNGVYPIFSAAGNHWLAGESVYPPATTTLDVFRYSPPVAAFFAPWSMLPDRVAGIAWRLLNAGVFLAGLAAWCRWQRLPLSAMLFLVIPLAVAGLNSGQCNALLIGSILLAHASLGRAKWWRAAAWMSVPVLLKGYPLAVGLLFCLIEPRRFAPRLAVCCLLGAALPYLCQRPDYVTEQFTTYVDRLRSDDRTGRALDAGYRDLHMLVRRFGVPMDLQAYRLAEVQLGMLAAGVVLIGRFRGWNRRSGLAAAVALGCCWMTLAGPATESSTYVLLSPVLAQAVLMVRQRPVWQKCLVMTSFVLFAAAMAVTWFPGWFARPLLATGVQPFAALLLTVHVVTECVRSLRNERGRRPSGAGRESETMGVTSLSPASAGPQVPLAPPRSG